MTLLYHAALQIVIALRELVFVCGHPSLWRFYIFFQVEYFFFSPYYLAERYAQHDDVYGFTPLFTAKRILRSVAHLLSRPMKSCHFLDLGCGDGRFVFLSGLVYRMQATGIERNPRFLNKCQLLGYALATKKVTFLDQDFLEGSFVHYDIIYLAWTTFSDETVLLLTSKLGEEVKSGAVVVTLSFPIDDVSFVIQHSQTLQMSWGHSQVFYQTKKE